MKNNFSVSEERKFGHIISLLRSIEGISMSELANRMGVSKSYICDVEQGRKNPSVKSLEKLATALNISLATLIELDDISKIYDSNRIELLYQVLSVLHGPKGIILTD